MEPSEASERERALKTAISHYLKRLSGLSPLDQLKGIRGDLKFYEVREIVDKRRRRAASAKTKRNLPIKERALSTLISLIDQIVGDLNEPIEKGAATDASAYWEDIRGQFLTGLYYQIDLSFPHYLNYCYLHALLTNHRMSPLDGEYRSKLRDQFDIASAGKLRALLMETLKNAFYEEIKHGGSKSKLGSLKRLQFLALYNRYLVVIKNVRKEKRKLKKAKKSDMVAKREAMAKFEIPGDLADSAFSDAPSEVALDWARNTLKINLARDYLKRLLGEIRREHRVRGYVVDWDLRFGLGIYSVIPGKEELHRSLLRYTPLTKPLPLNEGDVGSMLVDYRFGRPSKIK